MNIIDHYLWVFCLSLSCLIWSASAAPADNSYPDSNELYSYASPRTIADLKDEHMQQAMIDVTATITEVQKILAQDSSLPRLTRGEIEDLFEKVTRDEYRRSLQAGDYDRAKHMRSLMLVLPYNTNNYSEERLQELYTRPPVTKVIDSENKKPKPQQIVVPKANANSDSQGALAFQNNRIVTTYKPQFVANHNAIYTAPITTFHPKVPSKASFNEPVTSDNTKYTAPVTTFRPKTISQFPADFLAVATKNEGPSKSADKFSSHYNEDLKRFPASSVSVMRPNVKDLLATIGLQPDAELTPTVVLPTRVTPKVTTRRTTTSTTTTTTTTAKPELTPELKDLLQSFGLLTNEELPDNAPGPYQEDFQPIFANAQKDTSLFVNEFRPLPSTITKPSKVEINDTPQRVSLLESDDQPGTAPMRSVDFLSFKPLPIPEDDPAPSDDELEQLLKKYGLLDDNSRDQKSLGSEQERDEYEQMSASSSVSVSTLLPEKTPKMLAAPEVNVQFLPPDLMQVLDHMGIKNDKSNDTTDFSSTGAEAPASNESDKTESSTHENDFAKLHHLLNTIKQLDSLNANLTAEEFESLNLRRFNLSDELLSQGPDPLDHLIGLDVSKNEIKRQSNPNITDTKTETLEPLKVSLDLTFSTTSKPVTLADINAAIENEVNATDKSDELSDIDNDDSKDASTSSATLTAVTTESTLIITPSSMTSTEEPRSADAQALADSFGGDGLDPVTEALPPPKKNGFYFFSDWNSFLEVGEDPDKVIVRFDPKVGDPSRFIPVKIP